MSVKIIDHFLDSRLWGLIVKETRQTMRNKVLLWLLLFPPTLQLLIIGGTVDPGLHNVKLGIVDYDRSRASRDLIASITSGKVFFATDLVGDDRALGEMIEKSRLGAGLVIPSGFDRDLFRNRKAEVQVLVDGVDVFTANIAKSYLMQLISHYSPSDQAVPSPVKMQLKVIFNPGLRSSWYFVPGILGGVLTLTCTLVSSSVLLREKELGTLEQLLMTPVAAWEILLAKIIPLFFLLMFDVFLAVMIALLVFDVPFRGSIPTFCVASALYVCVGIGLGMMLATVCRTMRQAQLAAFFINIPSIQLSGAVVPYDTMPAVMQQMANFAPLRYYTTVVRSVMLKGAGIELLWPELLLLVIAIVVLWTFNLVRFRRQLS